MAPFLTNDAFNDTVYCDAWLTTHYTFEESNRFEFSGDCWDNRDMAACYAPFEVTEEVGDDFLTYIWPQRVI